MTIKHKIQKGFSLVTAIFLLVVLGTLGAMMATFFATQQQSSTLDVLGSRTYQAARAGIEWSAFNIFATAAGTGIPWPGCAAFPGPAPGPVLFAAGALAGDLAPYSVSLTCAFASAVEGTGAIAVYDITSTASYGGAAGNPDYVERVITVKMGH